MPESSQLTDGATRTADVQPSDALKEASQRLVGLLVQRAAQSATDRITGLSGRLGEVAENGGSGLTSALRGSRARRGEEGDDYDERDKDHEDEDDDGGQKQGFFSQIGSAFGGVKEKVTDALGIGGGGSGGSQGKKLKVTVISEDLDIGLPLRTTYDLWTQYADFPGFMKKVETVDQESDEKTNWQAKVFWSRRQWQATTVEQVPDSHISWKSQGTKGHVDGTVAFFEIAPRLTRVMLAMEYWPKGLFERTGNIWRAQGRRARLEFQHFRRYAMTTALLEQNEIEGWRGEIRDSEVVRTHEEAVAEEQKAVESGESAEPHADESDEVSTSEDSDIEDEATVGDEDSEPDVKGEDGADEVDSEYADEDYRAADEDGQGMEESSDGRYDEGDEYEEAERDEADEDYDAAEEEEPADEYDERYETDDSDRGGEYDSDTDDEVSTGNGRRRREPVAARARRGR